MPLEIHRIFSQKTVFLIRHHHHHQCMVYLSVVHHIFIASCTGIHCWLTGMNAVYLTWHQLIKWLTFTLSVSKKHSLVYISVLYWKQSSLSLRSVNMSEWQKFKSSSQGITLAVNGWNVFQSPSKSSQQQSTPSARFLRRIMRRSSTKVRCHHCTLHISVSVSVLSGLTCGYCYMRLLALGAFVTDSYNIWYC